MKIDRVDRTVTSRAHGCCTSPTPSWFALLNHLRPRCPAWNAELALAEHRRFFMEEHGWL